MRSIAFVSRLGAAAAAALVLCCFQNASGDVLVLDDPLQGSTIGTFDGGSGQFVSGGWKITSKADAIYWHLPYTVYKGAAEFRVRGLNPNECRPGLTDKSELFHMYDYTYQNADTNYIGYRNNPFKHFIRKIGCDGAYKNVVDALELVLVIAPNYQEPDTGILTWDPNVTYTFREEWGPDGNGNCVFKIYRDGVLLKTMTEPGSWSPFGHSVRIARARMDEWSGAPLDAVFSYVKVWDTETAVPNTPVVTAPLPGGTVKTRTPRIQWAWTPTFNRYQVRITTGDSPTSGIVWDSGEVASVRNYAITATLADRADYYVWVRLGNAVGWTDWSAPGRRFRVDTSYTPPNNGITRVVGNTLCDNNGPFLGLGFTYMEGLGFCKNDRDRFRSDVAFMASRGFNYMRILSEVPGACEQCYWYGRGIHPSNFTCRHGVAASAWPDYDQQFKDMLDIAYDEYGMRTEITIFGGAGESFPTYAAREAHCQRILNLIAGREHKVMFIEVANEGWQTGFDYPQGISDMRSLCQYIAERTSVPVAISATPWGSYPDPNDALEELYAGSAADIATEHFERDTSTFEGGWLPVRDCWRVEDAVGVPPCSSDEPIGPGSSVASETDPIKLVSAACFAWTAKLPSYVFHSRAGVRGDYRFEDMAGVNDFRYLAGIMPADLPNWTRNDGKEPAAPFTVYCSGTANKYWTDPGFSGATSGCHRNIGGIKGRQFVCYPQGIRSDGVIFQLRRELSFTAYNPLTGAPATVYDADTGAAVDTTVLMPVGKKLRLPQGPGAYIIKGSFPDDGLPPGPVVRFAANPGDGHNVLTWRNPTDVDFVGTRVVYRTDRYPASPTDGTLVCDKWGTAGASEQYVHSGLANGTRCYYAAFAYDDTPNYSVPSNAIGVPAAGQCFSERFTYPDGDLNGNRGWAGSGAPAIRIITGAVKITGGADNAEVAHGVSCSGSGGIIDCYVNVKLGGGDRTLWGVWFDDPNGKNLARWYGMGTTARPRIGGTSTVLPPVSLTGGWDTLRVRINTAADTSEFFFNGVSLGTLSHAQTGAGDSIGRVKLERVYNSTTDDYVFLDNLVIGPTALDTTPPGPVTGLVAVDRGLQVELSWANPTDSDYAGTRIVCKTSDYPADPYDGICIYDGTQTGCVHTDPPGGKICYAAYAYDTQMNFSPAATTSVTRPIPDCFADSFAYPNGSLNGSGGWSGDATTQIVVEDGSVKILGGSGQYYAEQAVSCDGGGSGAAGIKLRIKRGYGANSTWSVYFDDAAGANLARWYGSGLLVRGRIGGGSQVTPLQTLTGGWDELYVKLDFAANTSQFFFNGVSIGTLNHAEFGAGDSIGRVRFERLNYSTAAGHYIYLDDLIIGAPDTTAPTPRVDAPSVPITVSGPVSYTVSFDETVFGFNASSDVLLNCTGTAAVGSVNVTGSGAGPYTVTLSDITGSGTVGITVKAGGCYDAAGNPNGASPPSTAVTVVGTDGSIAAARQLADDTPVTLAHKALYLIRPGFGYIEEPDRTSGIRLEGNLSGNEGDLVVLEGTVRTTAAGEKYIQVAAMAGIGAVSLKPVGCTGRGVRLGLVDGLLVRTWGRVVSGTVGPESFRITDGSDETGLEIKTYGPPGVADGEFVTVTGAAGWEGRRVIHRK